jgi:hypothetical protein
LFSEPVPADTAVHEWPTFPIAEPDEAPFLIEEEQWLQSMAPKGSQISPPESPMFSEARVQAPQTVECMLCWQTFAYPSLLSQHLFSAHFSSPPLSPKNFFVRSSFRD